MEYWKKQRIIKEHPKVSKKSNNNIFSSNKFYYNKWVCKYLIFLKWSHYKKIKRKLAKLSYLKKKQTYEQFRFKNGFKIEIEQIELLILNITQFILWTFVYNVWGSILLIKISKSVSNPHFQTNCKLCYEYFNLKNWNFEWKLSVEHN